jgi:plasmid stability protein
MSALQIKNLDPLVHRQLKARAAHQGKSLSDLARERLTEYALAPTVDEIWDRARLRGQVNLEPGLAAALVRDQRGSLGAPQ